MMISVTSRGSDKPVCHGAAKVRYGYPRSVTIISTFYYGLLHSYAVRCVLTRDVNEYSNVRIFAFHTNIRMRFLDSNIRIIF